MPYFDMEKLNLIVIFAIMFSQDFPVHEESYTIVFSEILVGFSHFPHYRLRCLKVTPDVIHDTDIPHTATFEAKEWENGKATEYKSGHLSN
jgi:hypothetical protein